MTTEYQGAPPTPPELETLVRGIGSEMATVLADRLREDAVDSRLLGRPPPRWPKNCSNGVPANGLPDGTVTRCVVEMLTTAGWSFATMSAKLIGAPARGAAALIAPGSFCAVCAEMAEGWTAGVAAAGAGPGPGSMIAGPLAARFARGRP